MFMSVARRGHTAASPSAGMVARLMLAWRGEKESGMRHHKATVGMIGACMLWMTLAGAALANEFYEPGEAQEIQGADNLGKTIVHYLLVLGFPALSAVLMGGGALRLRKNAGEGGAAIASGVGVGWLGEIVNNLHSDAAAAVSLIDLPAGLSWSTVMFGLVLQAALVAWLVCYKRGRFHRVEALPERV